MHSQWRSQSNQSEEEAFRSDSYSSRGLGDPTDPENGWDVKFKRVKTGPLAYNVEYQLQVLKCKQRALDNEMALIAELKSMDDVMPRPTPDAQKTLLDEIREDAAGDMDEALEASSKCHDSIHGRLASKARSKECATRVGT